MQDIIAQLSPGERKIIPYLKSNKEIEDIATASGLKTVEVMRACEFLANKKAIEIISKVKDEYVLTKEGEKALKIGLAEERFYNTLTKPMTLSEIKKLSGLDSDELKASIGLLKKQGIIGMGREIIRLKDAGFEDKKSVLKKIQAQEAVEVPDELIKRGLVSKKTVTKYSIVLTPLGKKLCEEKITGEYVERLTSKMLRDGSWKNIKLRHYDVSSPLPSINYGRVHFVYDMIQHIKKIWLSMGFSEMQGKITQTAFWDLDVLFVPQDHPAREMQDTFYLDKKGKLPLWWKKIAKVHENGADTDSKGWEYKYDKKEAQKVLLRTHTTVLSAQAIKELTDKDLPAKLFSVAKVFRNETLDWKHLFEFHQIEGIIVGKDIGLPELIGMQKEFYKRMGFSNVRFRPAYFPYTEPSAEVEVFHPKKNQWVELGGMGIFRPEVVIPLFGKEITVLAWGLGMERLITDYYGITDLRELYDNNLQKLREIKQLIPEE